MVSEWAHLAMPALLFMMTLPFYRTVQDWTVYTISGRRRGDEGSAAGRDGHPIIILGPGCGNHQCS